MRNPHDFNVRLSDPDGLEEDYPETRSIQDLNHVGRRRRETSSPATRGNATHKDRLVECVFGHPDSVPEQRPTGEGAGRVHCNNTNSDTFLLVSPDQPVQKGTLSTAWWAGDSHDEGISGSFAY